ncbi:MAG: hypothetical protein ABIJ34_02395 [archaeon]
MRTVYLGILICLLFAASVSADYVINAKIDSNHYSVGTNITLTGTVYTDTILSSNVTVFYRTDNNTYSNTSTNEVGEFTTSLIAPDTTGDHNLTVFVGDRSVIFYYGVDLYEDILIEFVDDFIVVECSDDLTGVTTDVPRAAKECNATDAAGYYFIVINNTAGDFDSLFADTDAAVNVADSKFKYLSEESAMKIGNLTYTVVYIDPEGTMFVLAIRSDTYYEEATTQEVLVLGLNSSGSPVNDLNLTFEFINGKTDETEDEGALNSTSGGYSNMTITVDGETGNYYLGVEDSYSSVKIETFKIKGIVEDEDGFPVFKTSPDASVVLKLAVTNMSDNSMISGASGDALVTYPGGSERVILSADSYGSLTGDFTVPETTGEYTVLFTGNVSTESNTMTTKFGVVNYDLAIIPIAAGDKGRMDGFAPGQQGVILLTGKDSEGQFLNLTNIFNCSTGNISVKGIFDNKDKNYMANMSFNIFRLQTFLSSLESPLEEEEMQQIYKELGQESCVLSFTAPQKTNNYIFKMEVSLEGETYKLSAPVLVQDVFIDGWPTNEEGKQFVPATSIGGTVYLGIKAYDLVTGQAIPKNMITGASIIEVRSDGGLVTERMVNVQFSNSQDTAMLIFTANDSVAGFHDVKFRVKLNVTRNGQSVATEADAHGWFKEKLYSIWIYPSSSSDTKGSFGSDSTISLTANVRDAGGRSGIEGQTVSLDSLRYEQTGESISLSDVNSGQSASCDTDVNGTCILEFSAPSDGWDSGFYNLRAKVSSTELNDDGSETTMSDYGYGWFDVRNFYFYPYVNQFEISKEDDNITFTLNAFDFSGTPLNGTAIVKKIMYLGTWSSWTPPTVVSEDDEGLQGLTADFVNGYGNLTIDNADYISKSGNYMAILEATSTLDGSEKTEIGQAWFTAKTFALYVQHDWNQMTYATTDMVNLTLKGYEKISGWQGNEPTGTPKTLSQAWVQNVEREGMWGMAYKKRSTLETGNGMNYSCSGNTCYLWFNLSGFSQGTYNLVLNAKDESGNQVEEQYYMKIEVLGIRMPRNQFSDVLTTYRITNSTTFNLSSDCGSSSDAIIEPANVSSCKASNVQNGGTRIGDLRMSFWNDRKDRNTGQNCDGGEDCIDYGNMNYNATFFMLDVTNESMPRLYVKYACPDAPGDKCKFNESTYYTTGQMFNDTYGTTWVLKNIDVTSYKVTLEAIDAIIGYQGAEDTGEGALHNRYLIRVNNTWSKSGVFYQGPSLHDQEWLELDLDNDGIMDWQDEYPAIIADPNTAGQYDTLIVSNTTNFLVNGIISTGPVAFGGDPTYITNVKYRGGSSSSDGGSSGADKFRVTYTGNVAPDWIENNLGTVKPGTVMRIPVIITSPSNRSNKIENAQVNITNLVQFGMKGEKEYSLVDSVEAVNTSSTGIALLVVNTTGIPNGEYFLKIEVTYNGNVVTMGALYDNPRVNIRNFEVRGEVGNRGIIPGLVKISESEGNILVLPSDNMYTNMTVRLWDFWLPGDIQLKRGDWEFFNFYYNSSNKTVIIDPTPNDFWLTPEDMDNAERFELPDDVGLINYTTTKRGVKVRANVTMGEEEFNITLLPVHDLGQVMYNMPGGGRIVRVFNYSEYIFYLYTSDLVTHEAWDDNPNYVTVADIDGNVVDNYAFGESIAELDDFAIAKATNWDRDIVATDATIDDYVIKFPQWICDNTYEYYITSFSEESLNMRFEPEEGGPAQKRNLTNTTYYMLFYDSECDGVQQVSQAKMTSSVTNDTIDFSKWEQGTYEMKAGEQYGWPFLLNEIDTNNLVARIFKPVWDLWVGENTTIWIGAKDFSGKAITGNASILSVKKMAFTKMGEEQSDVSLIGSAGIDVNGNAYVPLNLWNQSWGDYTIKVKVTSNVTNTSEIQETRLFVMDPDMMMEGGDCECDLDDACSDGCDCDCDCDPEGCGDEK